MLGRWDIAIGDRVALAGQGVRYLVVDFEIKAIAGREVSGLVVIERQAGRIVIQATVHPSALVVLEKAAP
jgi:hypothetical protein